MNLALFYDTETTGLPLFNEPSEHPKQPHIVQLGACLVDLDARKVLSTLDVIVKPEGWTIPDDVAAIHGITTEHASDVGIAEESAIGAFMELWRPSRPRLRVGHNEQFDARILRIGLLRHFNGMAATDAWKAGMAHCTQLLSTPILKLPPTEKMRAVGRNHYKSANLREAYKHFTGQDLVDAHSAIADVRACMDVYFAIDDLKRQAAGGTT